MAASALPAGLVFRLALAVILDTAVHIVWKLAVLQLPNPGALPAALEAASREPLFLLVAALFVWQLVNWLQVLEGCDLSYSQPITALRSEEHTSELQSRLHLVCRLLLEKKKTNKQG